MDSNSIDPPNSPAGKKAPVQQRRPLPAAETGRSCWGCGQQDARAAQGTVQPLGAATRVPFLRGSRNPPAPTKKPQRIKIRCGFALRYFALLCREELPEYVQPASSAYKIIPEMPMTPAGKADYRKLEEELG